MHASVQHARGKEEAPVVTTLIHADSFAEPPTADRFSAIYKGQPTHNPVASVDTELQRLSSLIRVNYLPVIHQGTNVVLTFTLQR